MESHDKQSQAQAAEAAKPKKGFWAKLGDTVLQTIALIAYKGPR